MIKRFCENSSWLSAANHIRKKALPLLFDRILCTPLQYKTHMKNPSQIILEFQNILSNLNPFLTKVFFWPPENIEKKSVKPTRKLYSLWYTTFLYNYHNQISPIDRIHTNVHEKHFFFKIIVQFITVLHMITHFMPVASFYSP